MTQSTWYNAERVSQPGSVVLARWNAERQAARTQAAQTYRLSEGGRGTELFDWLSGGQSVAGVTINERSAMLVSAVYAAVSLLGGAVASMPLHMYRRGEDDQRERVKSDLWWLLNEQPAPAWSAAVAWEFAMSSLLLQGDSFWRILRASRVSPTVVGFEPMFPRLTTVSRNGDRLAYTYDPPLGGDAITLDQDDVLHIPGVGFDGLRGMSPIRHAALRQAAGVARAADEYSASFFANGARPDFALSTDQAKLSDDAVEILRKTWQERHGGPQNAGKPAVLTGGLKVQQLTMTAEDAQLLDTRRFQVEDIARIFGVPPFLIGAVDKSTSWGTGIEQQAIGFIKFTLQRHLVKFEQEINRKCFRTARNFCEFATAGLERGDLKSRYDAHRAALGRAGEPGFMTVNEVRALENLPPAPGGDTLNSGSTPNAAPTSPPAGGESQ